MSASRLRARQTVGRLLWIAGRNAPTPGTLTVLMYHAVTADAFEDAGQMSVSAKQFAEQMAEIADSRVDVVDLVDGMSRVQRETLDRALVSIVFDDGFVGVHDHAAGVLAAHRFPSTVFVSTAWIGGELMPLADGRFGRPLTWHEADALNRGGVSIGSHAHTHPRLASLSEDAIEAEILRSREMIADHVGRRPDTFAYPFGSFGSFDARTRGALAAHGFKVACTTVAGRNRRTADPLALRRIRVSWCDGRGEIRKALAGCYDWYRWVQRAQSVRAMTTQG